MFKRGESMNCALIMAGGKGTRFWPVSTEEKPKQFLNLLGNKSMLQMTVERVKDYIDIDRIFICTSDSYKELVKEQLPNISERNIIIEPFGMNTAPCIALSSLIIERYFPNSNIIVLPADHLIGKQEEFIKVIKIGMDFVNDNSDSLITLGIEPNRPETGYGYIKLGEKNYQKNTIQKVEKFEEKPNYEKALKYLETGKYLWNSGIFIWNSRNIINLIKKFLPNTYESLKAVSDCNEKYIQEIINENYINTDSISIDYGIMEKVDRIWVIPCNFGWDDVGSWSSLERYAQKDEDGNVFRGNGVIHNASNNIIVSKKPIVVNGIEDIIIVETDDYIMISSKGKEQEIKEAKAKLDNTL